MNFIIFSFYRQSVYFSGSFDFLRFMVAQVSGEVEVVEENRVLRAFQAVDIVIGNFKNLTPKILEPVHTKYWLIYGCFSV